MPNRKALFTIFLVVFIDLFGFGLVLPLLPYVAKQYEANAFTIGILTATYSLFQFIASPVLGRLSDRYGRKRLLVISQLGSVIGYLLLGLANSLPLLFLSRLIDGITGGNISVAQAYIADITTPQNRAKGMGVIGAAFGLGFAVGPALGSILYSIGGFSLPAYFAAVVGTLTALLTAFVLKETVRLTPASKASPKRPALLPILLSHPLGLIIVSFFLLNFAFSSMQGIFALWAEHALGMGPAEVGFLFTYIGIGSILNQLIILPRVVDRFGQRAVFVNSMIILGVGLLAIPFSPNIPILLLANTFLLLGNGLAASTSQSIASENVAATDYGTTLGVLQSAASLGRIIGPVIGGFLFTVFAPNVPFIVAATLVLGVYLLLRTYLDHEPNLVIRLRHQFTAGKISG